MDDNTIQIAVGLRLGSSLCKPHTCHHCWAAVDQPAIHDLSCHWSEGRHHGHASMNNIIHRALSSAHVPSRLEPTGHSHSDASCPDGITVVPWKYGRLLAWDATCPDTFAPSYISSATSHAGAALSEEKKRSKYLLLNHFVCASGHRDVGCHCPPVNGLPEGTWPVPPTCDRGG